MIEDPTVFALDFERAKLVETHLAFSSFPSAADIEHDQRAAWWSPQTARSAHNAKLMRRLALSYSE